MGISEDPLLDNSFWDADELASHRKSQVKTIVAAAVACLVFAATSSFQDIPAEGLPEPSTRRAGLMCVLAAAMLLEYFTDLLKMPHPKKQDEIYELVDALGF
eukprot:gnl/TRDRNA2_/TRDRNA2_133966_c0_seq3.p2 gnl/TRDRNA2_/TRDRNA2_133966_c0~~gnl/TRDRNA2_/TRDRNA2_133966_c0_seq3.p2  ORF type:complete len:102 (+),score=26.00 gnl/TRDRNA2_/TRDRNA2_133966_c0_seq3:66-371(+)